MNRSSRVYLLLAATVFLTGTGCVTAPPLNAEQRALQQQIRRDLADPDLARRMIEVGKTRVDGGPRFYGSAENEGRQAQPPAALAMPQPAYTLELRKACVQGRVRIAFIVEREGRTADVIALSEAQPALSAAAITAVRQWRVRPARVDGAPAPTRLVVPIGFTLE